MLESLSIRRYSPRFRGSENPSVQTISREGFRTASSEEPSETVRRTSRLWSGMKIQSVPHGDVRRSAEMTDPLRFGGEVTDRAKFLVG
jgi:hypothetical protein